MNKNLEGQLQFRKNSLPCVIEVGKSRSVVENQRRATAENEQSS